MPKLKKAGSLLTVAALAASTTLSGPSFAYAQEKSMRLAQAEEIVPAQPAPEEPATEAPPPEPEAAPEPAPEPEAAPEPAPEPQPAQEPEPAPEPAPQPEAAPEPAPEPEPAPAPVEEPAPEAPAPVEEPAAEAPAAAEPAQEAPAAETPAEQPAPAEAPAEPAPPEPAPAEAPADTAPADTAPTAPAPEAPAAAPVPEAAPAAPSDAAPAAPQAAPAPAAPEAAPAPDGSAAPAAPATAPDGAAAPAAPAPDGTVAPAAPAPGEAAPAAPGTAPAADGAAAPAPAAPGTEAPAAALAPPPATTPQAVPVDVQTAPVQQGAIDQSDARVQVLQQPVVVQSVTVEQGERLQAAPQYVLPPRAEVVERVGNRDIIAIAGAAAAGAAAGVAAGYFIRSNDDERLAVDSRETYVEQLPRGRTREVIVRPNGAQVITISNEYGDVIQRSRITPDGEEIVLFYDPYSEDEQRPDYFYDPAEDLPPLELTIPREQYIVDIDEPDEELYFDTIVAPPVETVERIYSVDEVRRSERIREKVRRIDVNTINFDFGSATISQAEVKNLQALADAVSRVIKDNPGETFLIEGHTDAVGSNVANLALSDQRAEAVATALSQYFEIPSENLVTQGYGEEDLKVDSQEENRENRRVTLRRITPLVKPVNTAQAK